MPRGKQKIHSLELSPTMAHFVIASAPHASRVYEDTPKSGVPWRDMINGNTQSDHWQANGTLHLANVATGERLEVECTNKELPDVTPAVVYSIPLSTGDDGVLRVAARPLPCHSLGHRPAEGARPLPDWFVFDDACTQAQDALVHTHAPEVELQVPHLPRRLFLARYMPMSNTASVVSRPEVYTRVSEMLVITPWILFVEGYVDHQGLEQALEDFDLTATLKRLLNAAEVPDAMWWGELFRGYVAIDSRLAVAGTPQMSTSDAPTQRLLHTLSALGVMSQLPNNDCYVSRLQLKAVSISQQFLGTYARVGRICSNPPNPSSTVLDALNTTDLLVVDLMARYHQGVPRQLASIVDNSLFVMRRADVCDQADLRRRFDVRAETAIIKHPVVVLIDVHTWSTTDVVRGLLPLLGARHDAKGGRYTLTGSGVPFKLLLIYNSVEQPTVWMRNMLKCGALPASVFYPRTDAIVASSPCPIYQSIVNAVLALELELPKVFLRTCRRLMRETPPNPAAPMHRLHVKSPLGVCRPLPPTDEGLSPEEVAIVTPMRAGLHLTYGSDIYVALRACETPPDYIFIYADPLTGNLPSPGVVAIAMCECASVILVADARFATLSDLFGHE